MNNILLAFMRRPGFLMMGLNDEGNRLETWGEIAAYFGVTIRTAQLWEKHHGLPVHRSSGRPRGRVYALTSELANWHQSRTTHPPKPSPRRRWLTFRRPK